MNDRRSLIEGVKPPAKPASGLTEQEQRFAFGDRPGPGRTDSRILLSTRIRADYAKALKRASLQRQLENREPHTLQDILEEAIAPWLRANGYLP